MALLFLMEHQHLQPILDYLEARDLYRQNKTEEAGRALSRAFGEESQNVFLQQNIDIALDAPRLSGRIVLDGIYGESRWIQQNQRQE